MTEPPRIPKGKTVMTKRMQAAMFEAMRRELLDRPLFTPLISALYHVGATQVLSATEPETETKR